MLRGQERIGGGARSPYFRLARVPPEVRAPNSRRRRERGRGKKRAAYETWPFPSLPPSLPPPLVLSDNRLVLLRVLLSIRIN